VRLELREQLAEMDAKKVDVDRFDRVTERKLEKTAIKEVQKDMNQMRSEFEVRLTEVGTKVDLIRRDQDRILTIDYLLAELESYVKIDSFTPAQNDLQTLKI
jgi:hypothetical protein